MSLRGALKPVNQLYGTSRVRDFGPVALKAVRQHMIDDQHLCRNEINRRMSRIKRAFKWAVSEELISPSVFHGLQAVVGLRRGRSQAIERDPVKPAPREVVEATIPHLSPQAAAICRLQLLTGMHPAEAVQMRPVDIDMTGDVWLYTPRSHKTEYLGREKHVPLGPKAQEVLKPFLDRAADACLFSPAEAEEWQNPVDERPPALSRGSPQSASAPDHCLRDAQSMFRHRRGPRAGQSLCRHPLDREESP